MKLQLFFISFIFSIISIPDVTSQDTIYLTNPSFEDKPRKGGQFVIPIKGWYDCGLNLFPDESPPDIHPTPDYAWDVDKKAKDGSTYLGLVTRYSATYESLSQPLKQIPEPGKCYVLSVYLSVYEIYNSPTRRSTQIRNSNNRIPGHTSSTENFANPVELRIWAGDEFCKKEQFIGRSGAIGNHDWRYYKFEFSPEKPFSYITIEAYFIPGTTEAYNGHILVDGFSPIIQVDCK